MPPRAGKFAGQQPRRFRWQVVGLYLAPTPLVFSILAGIVYADFVRLLWSVGGYAGFLMAAWLTREGARAADAFEARIVAKPPAFPRKLVAAALYGVVTAGILVIGAELNPILAAVYGAVAAGAHVACFGADPMRAKGGASGFNASELDRVAEKVDRAEAVVAEIGAAAARLPDRKLRARVEGLAGAARDILRQIQSDPRDLNRSRKFLSVHLIGLRDATQKFVSTLGKGGKAAIPTETRADYVGLIDDLEQSFAKHRQRLLTDDQTALEVEIEVLRGRLRQEGAL